MAGSLGLIQYKTNSDIAEERISEELKREEASRDRVLEQSIASQIRRDWESAKQAKREVQEQMIDSLRRYKGEYSPEKLAEFKSIGG